MPRFPHFILTKFNVRRKAYQISFSFMNNSVCREIRPYKSPCKRALVQEVCAQFAIAARRSCRLIGIARATFHYQGHAPDLTALPMRLRDLAEVRRRFGSRRLHVLLQRERRAVNHKRVYRLYREAGLNWRGRAKKKRGSHMRGPRPAATNANERYGMDFVSDCLHDGWRFRALTVVDTFTREAVLT